MFSAYFTLDLKIGFSSRAFILLFIAIYYLLFLSLSYAQTSQEKYWYQSLKDKIEVGEVVELKSKDKTIFSIYTENSLNPERGGVILLHGKSAHPDWKNVIKPLRINLPKVGWSTLSIQMPLKSSSLQSKDEINSFYKKGLRHINSAINFLREKKAKTIFLVAYDDNTLTALNFLKNTSTKSRQNIPIYSVNGLILISTPNEKIKDHPENSIDLIGGLFLPILDIYGSNDLQNITQYAVMRNSIGKRNISRKYSQQPIYHADHSYQNYDQTLVKRIHSWMLKITTSLR